MPAGSTEGARDVDCLNNKLAQLLYRGAARTLQQALQNRHSKGASWQPSHGSLGFCLVSLTSCCPWPIILFPGCRKRRPHTPSLRGCVQPAAIWRASGETPCPLGLFCSGHLECCFLLLKGPDKGGQRQSGLASPGLWDVARGTATCLSVNLQFVFPTAISSQSVSRTGH